MKGFPNQVTDLAKTSLGIQALVRLVDEGKDAINDGVFGEELIRAGVAGTGHTPIPVEEYINQQLTKPLSHQSFRTTARGLRELYRLLGFIDDSSGQVVLTPLGIQAVAFADLPIIEQIGFWRCVFRPS